MVGGGGVGGGGTTPSFIFSLEHTYSQGKYMHSLKTVLKTFKNVHKVCLTSLYCVPFMCTESHGYINMTIQ